MTQVVEHRLANGMRVLVREVRTAPVATCWVWYRVGSRNERLGATGISHWVEHMLFKGTPSIPKGEMDRLVARNGGTFNGFTSYDYTAYFETLPSDRIDLGLQIESDRMMNSLFDPEEVESERTVILAEREGYANEPEWWLNEAVMAAAFQVHPYRNEVIGWEADLLTMTRDDLFTHYQTFYMPNNATLVLVGDFVADQMLQQAEHYFGALPTGPTIPVMRMAEPPQQGERRVIVRRPGPAQYVQLVYHAAACRNADFAPLLVLDAVLSGAKPMSWGGGAQTNRSARLYRALVETQLAAYAGSSYRATIDPHLFEFSATVQEGHTAAEVEAALLQEITKIQQDGISPAELAKVQKQVRAQLAYSTESVTNQALLLGMWDVLDSYRRTDTLFDEIQSVAAADVQRVAQHYLTEQYRTVGHFLPSAESGADESDDQPLARQRFWSGFAPQAYFHHLPMQASGEVGATIANATRQVLSNGVVALVQRNPGSRTVSVRGEVRVGAVHESAEKNGLAVFTGAALIRGTATRSFQEIVAATEAVGASVNAFGGVHSGGLVGRSLAEDLPLILEILAEMLRAPTFPQQEFDRLREQFLMSLRESEQDTQAQVARALRSMMFPAQHPYSRLSSGSMESVSGLTRDDLAVFHRHYHPAGVTLAVVGDVDPPAVVDLLERTFGAWVSDGRPPQVQLPAVPTLIGVQRRDIVMPGKVQSDLVLGVHGLERANPQYYAASVANMILGRIGLGGRLGDNVRERQGLAYYCGSSLEADLGAGPWTALAGVNPANVERALEAILHEIEQFCTHGPLPDEMDDARSFMTGSLVLGLETNDGIAGTLLGVERHSLGLDFISRYPAIIAAIDAEQVREAARTYLSTEHYVVAVAGPAAE